ncbi:D-aminopeptidase [Thalassospira profundimaris]|uniref:D-aminopeptidase n=1 Tax=Thalassospira profundimaris TaxID=502049 RepID=A0A367XDC8_9PROT|nr:P1 family peptidase [Thalassospira profundimaris]RCK50791.1 D-aminopeptidase [Thalassospira profundimaris]
MTVQFRDNMSPGDWWVHPTGPKNLITDVPGVKVGHTTLNQGTTARTGVTAILPHGGDLFDRPVHAASAVLNGFGKSIGLVQLDELGEIETPIVLTNTFAVGDCGKALIKRAIRQNPAIGRKTATVNPLVLECNDGVVNDIQAFHVTEEMVDHAIDQADENFEQGTVGAGTGMKTFGFTGGIGSASRLVTVDGSSRYHLGALVLSNFGQKSELRVLGKKYAAFNPAMPDAQDKGSIIIVLATDAPLDSRQLGRISKRAGAALGRMGSFWGHQSGDIAIAFSTQNSHSRTGTMQYDATRLAENSMNVFFHATVEAVEEAVLNAMWFGRASAGYTGKTLPEFQAFLTRAS